MTMKKTLNLIIPVYNNRAGLITSLLSLGDLSVLPTWQILITIIDDCSTQDNYDDIPGMFKQFYNIELLKTPTNGGPGPARQMCLNRTRSEYVMFLDAGDIINSQIGFCHYLMTVDAHPEIKMFSAAHYEGYRDFTVEYVGPDHNRVHGKIYQTSFLKQYNLGFPNNLPSLNEDIGFNSACRLLCNALSDRDGQNYILEYGDVIVTWTFDENSITRRNNFEFFTLQLNGLGPHMVHAFETVKQCGVPEDAIETRAYESFMFQYLEFCHALNINQNVDKALEGCLVFYNYVFAGREINQPKFIEIYNRTMKEVYTDNACPPYLDQIPTFSIVDFLNLLEQERIKHLGE